MQETPIEALMQFVPLLIFSCIGGFVARALAKDKGRNVVKWTILGFIPAVNLFCIPFFIGASNLRLERKMDTILEAMGQKTNP